MKLRDSVPKVNGGGVHREYTSAQTYERVRPHLRRMGVTRVAEITWLDRIGIPVYNAIAPRSNDIISVYNGKGLSQSDARTSAVMEAVERFSAGLPIRPSVIASYAELVKAGRTVLDPRENLITLSRYYRDDTPISWVEAHDLMSGDAVLVPQDCVAYSLASHEPPTYEVSTTNGLASGNSLEEAICHALTELVERDSMTGAELVSNQLCQILEKGILADRQPEELTDLLKEAHPHVDPDSLPPKALALVKLFRDAGLELRVVHLTSDLGIPSFLAATSEEISPTTSQGHGGFGTHPDAEVAIIRAITECAQSRAVDIQAMREDIRLPDEDVSKYQKHVQRSSTIDKGAWAWRPLRKVVDFADIPSCRTGDVMDDMRFMLDRFRECGITRALAVDLSPPGIPVTVVRVMVPQLESWAVDHGRIGARGAAAWNRALAELSALQQKLQQEQDDEEQGVPA
ncbi:YcaO-like family protein [Actinacidiphila bryophytorum]|uniref:YcaO domain-containing protein n=1 Tax=Actinacidiphila bryophytorum TaxID=1436133 RepID=A0A9W4E325_9ACTN|nr:YcaO-like family protein [Actinacidiphila bryophytorum]MBM9436383.1 YcaO-like family protein [Actinacidiphila bryophytorum]MBN6545314.1 YcaO-like family protein [Actinacidiphila bryophytorum]CAG7602215.1 YcaO domain-containing protein [Actinacidiphila bryophytorum]